MYRYRRKTRVFHLPTELLEDIFCRLGVKKIVQLRFVCKTWYGIITNPSFIFRHADWCAKNHNGYLLYHNDNQSISRLDKGFNFSGKLEFPIQTHEYLLVGSCDGLLCMRPADHELFPSTYLWNPSIRALKRLPDNIHLFEDCDGIANAYYASAFGFDRKTNDYKFFQIVLVKLQKQGDYVMKRHLYSLNNNSWRVIQGDDPFIFPSRYAGCRTYFNGAFYWALHGSFRTSSRFIMRFDFCDETISKIELPVVYDDKKMILSMGSLKNSLVLYISDAREGRRLRSGSCTIQTWLLLNKLNSPELIWERQLSVEIPSLLAWPLTTGLDGEILIFKYYNNLQLCLRFGVYDLNKQSIKEVDIRVDKHIRVRGSFTYSESLLLLGDGYTY